MDEPIQSSYSEENFNPDNSRQAGIYVFKTNVEIVNNLITLCFIIIYTNFIAFKSNKELWIK